MAQPVQPSRADDLAQSFVPHSKNSRYLYTSIQNKIRLQEIPVSCIEAHEHRTDSSKDLAELCSSLSVNGQLSPIRVRPDPTQSGHFRVIFGNRRLQAANRLGWKTISAEVVDASDADALVMAFSENADRTDFSDYEKALLLAKIHETTGKKYTEVASLIGRSSAFISQHVAMLHLFSDEIASKDERVSVLSSLTEGHARLLARIEDPTERWNTAKLAVAAHIGVRELTKFCSRGKRNPKARDDHDLRTLSELVNKIVEGMTSKNILSFSSSLSEKRFTMFSSFQRLRPLRFEDAVNHVSDTVKEVDRWKHEIEDLTIRTAKNFAFATMIINYQINRSGRILKTRIRATIIFEKEVERWKAIHGHWSSVQARKLTELPMSFKLSNTRNNNELVNLF